MNLGAQRVRISLAQQCFRRAVIALVLAVNSKANHARLADKEANAITKTTPKIEELSSKSLLGSRPTRSKCSQTLMDAASHACCLGVSKTVTPPLLQARAWT